MNRTITLVLLVLTPLAHSIEYREDLAPPDVDFYLELMATRMDYGNLGGGDKGGFRIRGGLDLKDVTWGRWMWRAEAGLSQFGESNQTTTTRRPAIPGVELPPITEVIIDSRTDLRLGGVELGARLYDQRLFFVRGGVFLYNLKTRNEETRTPVDANGDPVPPVTEITPDEISSAAIGPYLGTGLEFDLVPSVRAVLEFDVYRIEGEYLNNLNLGFQFRF